MRKNMTSAYCDALRLPTKQKIENLDARKAALDRAHDLRKFEIENYWKRATYFWSFQVIAFVVLGFILKDGNLPASIQILQIPAAIGATSGFVGYLSAKGSKFWQENWESHVDMLEQEIEGRLTQSIWSDGKRSHSVSRLNQAFILTLTLSWIAVMAFASCDKIPSIVVQLSPWCVFVALLVILAVIGWYTRQNFTGYILSQDAWVDDDTSWVWSWKKQGDGKDRRQLMLRHTRAKDATKPDK